MVLFVVLFPTDWLTAAFSFTHSMKQGWSTSCQRIKPRFVGETSFVSLQPLLAKIQEPSFKKPCQLRGKCNNQQTSPVEPTSSLLCHFTSTRGLPTARAPVRQGCHGPSRPQDPRFPGVTHPWASLDSLAKLHSKSFLKSAERKFKNEFLICLLLNVYIYQLHCRHLWSIYHVPGSGLAVRKQGERSHCSGINI